MDKIAIIIVNYNGLAYTLQCIESIRKSSIYNQCKIIVVDNASKKDDGIIIKENYSDIVVIFSEINGGFSYGNNLGIREAQRDGYSYIMLLNNDTEIDPNMIELLKEKCDRDTVTVPKMYYYSDPNRIWFGGGMLNPWTGDLIHVNQDRMDAEFVDNEKECSFATGCCMMFHASVIEDVGLMDEKYFLYYEDAEFSIRLMRHGKKIVYVPDAKLWHKVNSSTSKGGSAFMRYYMNRNRLLFVAAARDMVRFTAFPYTLLTRYIRMWQCKDKAVKEAIKMGIDDFRQGVFGKKEDWL